MSNPILAKLMELVARLVAEGKQPPFTFSMISAHGAVTGRINVEQDTFDSDIWTQHIDHPNGLGIPVTLTLLDQRGVLSCLQITAAGENRIVN